MHFRNLLFLVQEHRYAHSHIGTFRSHSGHADLMQVDGSHPSRHTQAATATTTDRWRSDLRLIEAA